MAEQTAILEAKGLAKTYGTHTALRGIDLDLEAGEVVGFSHLAPVKPLP